MEITWALAALSLLGVVLNIRKRRACFALWIVTNTSWAVVDYDRGLPAQAALFAVYAALAIWGWFAWRPAPGCGWASQKDIDAALVARGFRRVDEHGEPLEFSDA